jgi:DNA polymerase III delta prime subunit
MDIGHANGGSRFGGEVRVREVPIRNWDELVLPEHQRELLRAIPRRLRLRHVTGQGPEQSVRQKPVKPVLFVGPAGTGKTLAAQIIAADLDLPIQELDLAAEPPQQTAKLKKVAARAFQAAGSDGAILVIDGAGPLLRPPPIDEHGPGRLGTGQPAQLLGPSLGEERKVLERLRSYLLERSDQYDGLVIFTSTVTRGIDPAMAQRFDVVINFPFPDSDLRKELWRRSLPQDAQLTESTLDYLSNWLRWPGGTIHRCCLEAADAAAVEGVPVQLRHVAGVLDQKRHGTNELSQDAPAPSRPRPDEPPENQIARAKVRRGLRLTALGGVVAAAIVGLILAGTAPSSPARNASGKTVHVGSMRVSVPSNWRQEPAPATSSLGLTGELAVASPAPARGLLIVGKTAASNPSVLPPSLLATLRAAAAPQIVKVDRVVFYRYVGSAPSGRATSESVYAMPTTSGTIIGVCRTEGTASAAFMSSCERVLSTLKLTAGSALPLALNTHYAHTLNSVINQLNTVRSTAGAQLAAATTAHAQAAAATTLARAHAQAGSALVHVGAGVASGANAALAHALLTAANAYSALANAAAHNDAHAYSAARTELGSTAQALSLAFGQLRRFGYRVA